VTANLAPAPAPAAERRAVPLRRWLAPWLLAWLTFLPVVVLRAGTLAEADTFWEVRAGLLTIAHRAIPAADPFSWTVRGKPWTLNSWGFDVLLAAADRVAGLPGVALLCAGFAMVIAGLVLLLARHLGASPLATAAVLLLSTPLLVGWLTARPQLADYLAALVLVLLLRRMAAGRNRPWCVAAVGTLSVAWVNLHAGALLGVALTAGCAAVLLARRGTRGNGWWCLAAAGAALAGVLASPYGTGVFRQSAHVQSASAGLIVEWQHLNPLSPVQDLTLLLGLLALAVAARRGEAVLAAVLAVTAAGSLMAVRFLPFVVLFAVPVLAVWASAPPAPVLRYLHSRRVMFCRCGTLGLVAFTAVAVPSLAHIGRPNPDVYPAGILSQIPAGCKLFNADILGGFVILERPAVPVSLDTRNDLYGRRMLLREEQTLHGRGNLVTGLRGAGCVLIPPAYGLASRLATDPAWQLRAADAAAVLFVRR
jgi:hypothetical protein